MSCCDEYTYKCDKCRKKFCISCQRAVNYKGIQICSECYYRCKGLDADKEETQIKDQKEKIKRLESEIAEHSSNLNRMYDEGRLFALTEMQKYLETLFEPLDKVSLLREINQRIIQAENDSRIVQ